MTVNSIGNRLVTTGWCYISLSGEVFFSRFNEKMSEQAHIPHAPTLLENAVYNEWQFQALGTGNRTKKGI